MTFEISVKQSALRKLLHAMSYRVPLWVCTAQPSASDIKGTPTSLTMHPILHIFLFAGILTVNFLPLKQL